jgi:hypothetical protein
MHFLAPGTAMSNSTRSLRLYTRWFLLRTRIVTTRYRSAVKTIFRREGCTGCHTPPLYTNNKLIPAGDFTIPVDSDLRSDILPIQVGTDSRLALASRRGTGYYKVPSLRGVWYRGPFEHNGSVATLGDWFDPRHLRDDYVPTGFVGYGVKTRPVRGHEFGLRLSSEDKAALISFLNTL